MKRFWIRACVLALVFAAALVNSRQVENISSQVSGALLQASDCTSPSDAQAQTELAQSLWREHTGYLSLVLRRSDIDEITGALEALLPLLEQDDRAEFARACAQLVEQLGQLAQGEQLRLGNLL